MSTPATPHPDKGLTVDLEAYPPGVADISYRGSKGIADDLLRLDPEDYARYPWLAGLFHSPYMGRLMQWRAASLKPLDGSRRTSGQETMAMFNHRFVTLNDGDARYPDSSLNRISVFDVIRHFDPSVPEADWPTLLLTSNHALTSHHKDIGVIMHGIKTMLEHATKRPLSIEAHPDEVERAKGKTILLSSVFTEETPQENGSALIKGVQDNKRNAASQGAKNETWGERALRRHVPTTTPRRENISPASIQLAKLLLALMVTEPERIHMDRRVTEAELATGNALDRPGVPEDMQPTIPPLVLRRDASRVLSRVLMAGYSKGGNTVSDAARWLLSELQGQDHWTEQQGDTVARREGSFFLVENQDGEKRRLEAHDIKRIMSSLGVISLAAGEKPLTKSQVEAGMRRLNIVSTKDRIAQHFIAGETFLPGDQLIEVEGTDSLMGHRPDHALLSAPGMETGYIVANRDARQRLRVMGMQLHPDTAAIRDASNAAFHDAAPVIKLEFRAGVLRQQVERWRTELEAHLQTFFRQHSDVTPIRREDIQVGITPDAPSALLIRLPESLRKMEDIGGLLRRGLKSYCEPHHILVPGYVAQDIQRIMDGSPSQTHAEEPRTRKTGTSHERGRA